ncbi:hypothetical protein [Curtobacterium sp. MCBD17_040]|uniref:hypothetical protein n=1 Tax=Curtobacterium sp. MCBD17_040 TaxID=2175674 RepID=UPI000DA7D0FB|nr:hypothetical protein [Curtobacterium sp. MCBD17_040]WIB65618.1 hypothetical protein DEI94_15985 [Curtobacterium sp. MCBD17_040]
MPLSSSTDDVAALLAACSNQFGKLLLTNGSRRAVLAIQAFTDRPTERRWSRARDYFVAWDGERYTLERAVAVFSSWDGLAVPTREQVLHALRVVTR